MYKVRSAIWFLYKVKNYRRHRLLSAEGLEWTVCCQLSVLLKEKCMKTKLAVLLAATRCLCRPHCAELLLLYAGGTSNRSWCVHILTENSKADLRTSVLKTVSTWTVNDAPQAERGSHSHVERQSVCLHSSKSLEELPACRERSRLSCRLCRS